MFKLLELFYGRFITYHEYKDGVHGFYMAAVIAINYFLFEMKAYEHLYAGKERRAGMPCIVKPRSGQTPTELEP